MRKTLSICFLTTTIFSILFLSYTMYLVYGTAQAVRSLTASISEIEIKEDISEASFLILIHNPSSIHLGLFSYHVTFNFQDGKFVYEKQTYSHQSLPLGSNSAKNISIDIPLDSQTSYSTSGWTLYVNLRFQTPIPGEIVHSTVLEK